ncbi:fructosamine kinase family protein [Dactylosporangium sp. CS-033363]|uniref:fructosamine kinase family protein n=1 Tax=Dactylosporangium sp. CS-033363 TaxID=3239935 RepID=UPI003D8F81E0
MRLEAFDGSSARSCRTTGPSRPTRGGSAISSAGSSPGSQTLGCPKNSREPSSVRSAKPRSPTWCRASYGHPEADLALVDYFAPVREALFDGYREVQAIEEGFAQRKELWRLHGYLAVVDVEGARSTFLPRVAEAVARVRCRHVGSAG